MRNRFAFGNGNSTPYSYMVSIAECLQNEGCLVRQIWQEHYPEDSYIVCGINFSWTDCDHESIFLHQLKDGTIVIYFDEDIDIEEAFGMFKKIRSEVGM